MLRRVITLILGGCLAASLAMGAGERTNPRKNVLLLCVDDLRPELKSFGASYIHSPNIDALAAQGRAFQQHYVNAPSCGPSRYAMLTGLYPVSGRANQHLLQRAEKFAQDPASVPPSMPEWFRTHGYTTVSVGKVSHYPGGRMGKGWADDTKPEVPNAWDRHLMPVAEWENPEGAMHGYAHGKVRIKGKQHDLYESVVGPDTIYPDGFIVEQGIQQLEALAAGDQPFFLAIGLIKPHLPFGAPQQYLDLYDGVEFPPTPHATKPTGKTTWHRSGEFMGYNRWGKDPNTDADFALEVHRHYAACVSYADKHVGDIIAKLKETGADKNTIIVLWGDHGWHLGEHSVWGKHTLFEESLHAPLIVIDPSVVNAGQPSHAIVDTLDVFPTLCDLTGLKIPDFAQGVSLRPMLEDPNASGHPSIAYFRNTKSIRTEQYRLTLHQDGYTELYDHASPARETVNIAAAHPDVVAELSALLSEELPQ